MFMLREGIFECCNPASLGEPEFLAQDNHISNRATSNLFTSASGSLKLYFQQWRSDRHQHVRAVVFVCHGELEHCGWYNALAVKLAAVGCTTFAPDAQGCGQSDGARGYFESFEDLVCDYVEFVKLKWAEVLSSKAVGHGAQRPGFVLMGKGSGALVVMRALIDLYPLALSWGVTPVVVLISPAFQFASFISEQSNVSCGLNSGQCQRQPAAQCARAPVAFTPVGEGGPYEKLEYMSQWFPKMIVTKPVDPDMVSRDPQTVERMSRDVLCWRQGYRARVFAELVHEQRDMADTVIKEHPEVFQRTPGLILHGNADKIFAVHGSHGMHSVWCDVAQKSGVFPRLKIYDGAFHQLLNEPNKDEVMNDIVLFVASKVSVSN